MPESSGSLVFWLTWLSHGLKWQNNIARKNGVFLFFPEWMVFYEMYLKNSRRLSLFKSITPYRPSVFLLSSWGGFLSALLLPCLPPHPPFSLLYYYLKQCLFGKTTLSKGVLLKSKTKPQSQQWITNFPQIPTETNKTALKLESTGTWCYWAQVLQPR